MCFTYLSKEIKETISLEITVDLTEQTTTFHMKNANDLTDILENLKCLFPPFVRPRDTNGSQTLLLRNSRALSSQAPV